MFSLYNILTIARFEVKTLFRSWFFRVFAILTLGILGFMNILWFTDAIEKLPWGLRAIPGSVPYLNMMFYNIAQAIIAVFIESGLRLFELSSIKQEDIKKSEYDLSESWINYFGYRLMSQGEKEDALKIFKLNTELYPDGFNTFDSYGECLLELGNKESAIIAFKKSLELNPENETAKKILAEID